MYQNTFQNVQDQIILQKIEKFSSMSKTFCQLQEISLVNLISFTQLKLQKNFEIILRYLNDNSNKVAQLENRISAQNNLNTQNQKNLNQSSQKSIIQLKKLQEKCGYLFQQVQSLKNYQKINFQWVKCKVQNFQNQIKNKWQIISSDSSKRKSELQYVQNQQNKILDIINLKSQKSENQMDRVRKDIGQLIIKSQINNKKIKSFQQKIINIQQQNQNNPFLNIFNDGKNSQKYYQIISKIATQVRNFINSEQKQNKPLPRLLKDKNLLSDQSAYLQSTKRSSFVYSPLFNQQQQIKDMKQKMIQMKSKLESYEMRGNQGVNKALQKIYNDINELRNMRNDMKRESGRDKKDISGNSLLQKIQELRPQINKIYSRIDTIDDKINYSEKKLEQNKKNTSQLLNYVKQNNLSKYDQKIKSIQSQFFTQIKDIISKIQTKTNNTQFLKVSHQNQQKFKQINEILITKCQKVEVKKALLFIQSKIKQIILVISQDQQNEKDALITKKNVKCISCDKQLDKYSGLVGQQSKNWNLMPHKELQTENLGKFGITKFGSLAKKLKKLEGGELPLLRSKKQTQ